MLLDAPDRGASRTGRVTPSPAHPAGAALDNDIGIRAGAGEPSPVPAGKTSPPDLGVKPHCGRAALRARTRQLTSQACRREPPVHATPTRGVRRFARPGAVALATLGVLAGTTALTWPADPTATANPAATSSTSRVAAHVTTIPTLTVINTAPKLRANRSAVAYRQPVQLTGMVRYGRTTLVRSRLVWLQIWNGKVWRTIETKKLSASGVVRFTARPTRSVYFRLAMPTQSKSPTVVFNRATSPRLLVKVMPRTSATRATTTARTAAAGSVTTAPQGSSIGARVVAAAARQTGKWYLFGAAGPSRFDCSGLTLYVFRQFGVMLPHNANAQKSYGRPVSRANARPGDLVVFLSGGYGYHVGIYAGGGYMYDSPRAGRTVGKHKIWSTNIVFRRLV